MHEETALRYGLADPTTEELTAVAGRWQPYRSWAAVLLRAARGERTGGTTRRGR